MKRFKIYFLLALSIGLSGACTQKDNREGLPENTPDAYEKAKIIAGLEKLGISDEYEIVIADSCELVEKTAAEMLQKFLFIAGINAGIFPESKSTAKKRFLLGRETNLKAIRDLGDVGKTDIRSVSPEDDGFHLKSAENEIVIAGANPRGVLYGVYAFEDYIHEGTSGVLDIKKVPFFRKRGSGLFYTDVIFTAELEDFPEEKAICLSRLGINQMTDQGIGGFLRKFVKSDVFPFQTPPDADFQRKVKEMSAICSKYGIDMYLFIVEPELEAVSGGFERYPKEVLGTARPPWGGDKDGLAKTLCVNSPIAQKHLQNMMRKLVLEYPDVKGVNLYNLDMNSWLCTPELCDRCKEICTDSPPDVFTPWETQARLVTLLAEAAHEVNPDFDFSCWGAVHFHGDRLEKMVHAAREYNGLLSSWTASDRSIMVPDSALPDPAFIISQKICSERAVPFHMICEMNNLEVIPKSLPFPFHVCDAIKKYKKWDIKYLTEIYGLAPEHNSINSLVMKEFQWNPDQDPQAFLTDLSVRQFGKKAGIQMYQAWKEMEKAFDVWNDIKSPPFPLMGSQFHTKMGPAIGGLPPAILPDVANYYETTIQILNNVEPWLNEGFQRYREVDFQEKMNLMDSYLSEAAEYAKKAITLASEKEFIGICYYHGTDGRPTCKEYAELNYAPIAIMESLCRQRCNIISAYHLLTDMEMSRVSGDEKTFKEKEKLYHELIKKDIRVLEEFCELLEGFAEMHPCYTRTSLTEKEITDYLSFTRDKIDKLKSLPAFK